MSAAFPHPENTDLPPRHARWLLGVLLGAFVLAHLPRLTQPPLDEHHWRQTDTAAVARNFAEESADILHPRIDMRMEHSGVTGMEFPAFNYALFLLNLLLGFAHWHGRLLSLAAGTVGLGFLAGLVWRERGARTALFSVATLATSRLFFYYARNIQPDTTMVTSAVGCLYFISRYRQTRAPVDFVASVGLLSLACLIKIPAAVTLLPWALLLGRDALRQLARPLPVLLVLVVMVAPVTAWYVHSAHLSADYGLGQYFYGALGPAETLQALALPNFWRQLVFSAFAPKPISWPITLLSLVGLSVVIRQRAWWVPGWLLAVFFFLIVFANKSYVHNYYALPQTPPLAVMTGVGCAWTWDWVARRSRALAHAMVALLSCTCVANLWVRVVPAYEIQDQALERLEAVVDSHVPRGDRVITNYNGVPTMLYFAHRKGWSLPPQDALNPERLTQLRGLGARHLILRLTQDTPPPVLPDAQLAYSDAAFAIYHFR